MDLAFLQPLYAGDASVVSVHLDTSRGAHDADKQIELRRRAARRSLSEQGAQETDLAVLDDIVGGPGTARPAGRGAVRLGRSAAGRLHPRGATRGGQRTGAAGA
ncbi:hypothetical protein SSPO_098890 [Streptomyces antimycoticus]|uniref:Uncharacterized protein n=1 Tax=Streptomyces antimycoticus TaxID=68175 RepID=A0A499VCC2_9ACTN|nr:hypothetical protein [Streptomyces antimycoticus]BBJ47171.1 hypothetical protein SSPO_098890 [Streptomyces antimycoticus]